MTTTIAPSAGQTADFLQLGPGATASYGAIDLRRAFGAGLQEGVVGTNGGAYKVTLSSGMILTIAASTADGALVQGDTITAQGLYLVPPHSAAITETVTAAHATLPRIDTVVLEILDANHDGGGSNLARTRIIAGTATAGATLDNRTGAAALPSSALLLADVLVPAAAASILAANIRDRRRMAAGALNTIKRTSGDLTTASTTAVVMDSTNLNPRIECSGVPVRVQLIGRAWNSGAAGVANFELRLDAAVWDDQRAAHTSSGAGTDVGGAVLAEWMASPSAASHLFAPYFYSGGVGTVTVRALATTGVLFVIEELVRQNASYT